MKKFFTQQLEYGNPITSELLSEMINKQYYSGENIEVNDVMLYAFKVTYEIFEEEEDEKLMLDLVTLCEREFNRYDELYTIIPGGFNKHLAFPIFIEKNTEEKYYKLRDNYLKKMND